MILNEALLGYLTTDEKKRYEDLFVMRKEAKEVMKPFRKDYNTLKSNIKKLEKYIDEVSNELSIPFVRFVCEYRSRAKSTKLFLFTHA